MSTNRIFFKLLWQDLYQIKWPVLVIILYWILTDYIYGIFCPLKIFCGYPCPCCGISRAYLKMLQWKWNEAFELNPMSYTWFFVGFILFIQQYFFKPQRINMHIFTIIICIITILVFGINMKQKFPEQEPYTYYENNILSQISKVYRSNVSIIFVDTEN